MPPRTKLDTAAVVRAAADLLDKEGAGSLSLSRLAELLGIQTPSLYNHIDGLPGLQRELALLNARLLGECLRDAAIGKAGPEAVQQVAQAYRTYIKSHPGLYMTSLRAAGTRAPIDADLKVAEEEIVKIGLAVIASFGLTGTEALHALRGLRSVVHGFATLELAGGFGLPLDCDESFRRLVKLLIQGLQGTG
jgi:AcrR family transcriptional regulator